MKNDFRHEFKHYISGFDAIELSKKLKILMQYDDNTDDNGQYLITSLYFDNHYDKALREKLDGVSRREKFRIRYYNRDTSFMRLEKKSKIRGLCLKQSCPVTKEECEKLLSGDISWLSDNTRPLLQELKVKMTIDQLRPKVIVEYVREAFTEKIGNVRVTIDSRIKSSYNLNNFLVKESDTLPLDGEIILEVKYDKFIPSYISDIVQLRTRQSAAYSKYAACRIVY